MRPLLLAVLLLALCPFSYTQNYIRCYTVENQNIQQQQNPNYDGGAQFENWLAKKMADHTMAASQRSVVFTIPTVVHIIYSDSTQNISDSAVFSQIEVLNEDFRRTNADAVNTPAAFLADAVDTEIEFCLATIDPNGNPTNGIDRVSFPGAPFSTSDFNSQVKPATGWNPNDYFNIWVGPIQGGILGYAIFPDSSGLLGLGSNGPPDQDGVVILTENCGRTPYNSIAPPYNLGRTTTHEVGHWLGLRHIWGDGGCGLDDFCADTPESDGSNFGCDPTHISCGTVDMVQNYMDYSNDACMNLFTNDQKTRMRTVLMNSPRRASLVSSMTCVPLATNPPTANYDSDIQSGCAPLYVQFQDSSTGQPSSWYWDFGDGNSSTQQNPNHTFTAGGTFSVSLIVSNIIGSDTFATQIVSYPQPFSTISGPALSCLGNIETYCTSLSPSVSYTFNHSGLLSQDNGNCQDIQWTSGGWNYLEITALNTITGCQNTDSLGVFINLSCGLSSSFDYSNTQCSPSVTFTDSSSGAITSWAWDFGDGNTSTQQHPIHTYSGPGTYVTTLIVSDIGGTDISSQVYTITTPPSLNLSGPSYTCMDSSEVYCTTPTMSSYSYSAYSNGGTVSATGQPAGCFSIQWNGSGNQDLVYTVYDSSSTCSSSDSMVVLVDPNCVIDANFYSQFSGCVNTISSFFDLSSGNIDTWNWDMGDGNLYSTQNLNHTYTSPGNYTVTLIVSNAFSTDSFIQQVTVHPPFEANLGGSIDVCEGSTEEYCASGGNLNFYAWSVTGGTSNAAWLDSCASVNWGLPGTGTVYVSISDSLSGCIDDDTLTINIIAGPLAPNISGDTNVVENSILNQYCAPIIPGYSYNWMVSGGIIPGGNNSNCVLVDWGSAGIGSISLELTDSATSCSSIDSLMVDIIFQNPNILNGYVYEDLDSNCIMDPGEVAIANTVIEITPGPHYAVTDTNGYFEIILGDGSWEVNEILPNTNWNQSCPSGNSYTINFGGIGDTTTVFFGNESKGPCGRMWVDFSTWIGFDPCQSSIWKVFYGNEGNQDVQNAYIEITFDSYSSLTSSGVPYTTAGPNTYTFDLGFVAAGTNGYFYVYTFMDCAAPMGATLCEEISIFPHDPCTPPSTGWDKSSVMVTGYCSADSSGNDSLACFDVTNTGDPIDGDMDGPTEVRIFENNVFVHTSTLQLLGGETQTICWASGGSIRLEVDQRPGHPGNSHPNDVVENCGSGNSSNWIPGLVNSMSADDYDDFHEVECYIVGQSYDPNDKHVNPIGITDNRYISPSDDLLEYKIRFQNTGTAAAIHIVVRDTLSPNVDITTLNLGVSSHDYELVIEDSNVLVFTFSYIMLPDSTSDLEESQGYIKFKIKTRPGLTPGTVISNKAAIYFDLNPPIITNDAWVTILDTVLTSLVDPLNPKGPVLEVKTWPNPAKNQVSFHIPEMGNTDYEITITDMLGRKCKKLQGFGPQTIILERGDLSGGVYLFNIKTESGLEGTGKFIFE